MNSIKSPGSSGELSQREDSDSDDGGDAEVYAYISVVLVIGSQAPGLKRWTLNLLRRQSRGVKR